MEKELRKPKSDVRDCVRFQVFHRENHIVRQRGPLNMNHYANKKSAAESMLDVALLMANASQLKAVLEHGPSFTFYVPLITLLSISLILQIVVGVMLIFIGKLGIFVALFPYNQVVIRYISLYQLKMFIRRQLMLTYMALKMYVKLYISCFSFQQTF